MSSCVGVAPPNTGWATNAETAIISAGNIFRVDLDIIFLFLGMRRNSPPVRAFWAAMSILIIPSFLGRLTTASIFYVADLVIYWEIMAELAAN
jgi:hypothetical protein